MLLIEGEPCFNSKVTGWRDQNERRENFQAAIGTACMPV